MGQGSEKQEVRILAQATGLGESCSFIMYPPLYDGITASFLGPEEAAGSPLPEALFRVEGVTRVLIAPNKLTVFRDVPDPDWSGLGKEIGRIIREHHESGAPVVSEGVHRRLEECADLATRIQQVLDTEINPAVASHGGFISLLEVKGSDVYLQMGGGCQGCGMAQATLKQGVAAALRQHIPEIREIYDSTDHASGTNPYYHAS